MQDASLDRYFDVSVSQQTSIILGEGRITMAKGMDRKKETKKPKKKTK
jgi:hypothetical protein